MLALQHFTESLPRRPYCTDNPKLGQTVRARDEALRFANIQPNTSGKVSWMTFDVDHHDGATCWHRFNAPPPTLAVENPDNGHAHLLYALQSPVPRTDAARAKPLMYLAATQEGMRRKLEADRGYSGHLCKNPLSPRWRTQQWAQSYSLADLSDWIDLPSPAEMRKRVRNPDYAGLGRNCELFERLRPVSYSLVRKYWKGGGLESFTDALRLVADDLNAGFGVPLPMSEVKGIARSCARWTWKHFDPASFREIQSRRGARKGHARRSLLMPDVLRLIGEGKSQREVAAAVGVNHATVSRWLAHAE